MSSKHKKLSGPQQKYVRTPLSSRHTSRSNKPSRHGSPMKSGRTSVNDSEINYTGLIPDFRKGFKFCYGLLVNTAFSKMLVGADMVFCDLDDAFKDEEIKVYNFTDLAKEKTFMDTLKERDRSSPTRRKHWVDRTKGKGATSLPKLTLNDHLSTEAMESSRSIKSSARKRRGSYIKENSLPLIPESGRAKNKQKQSRVTYEPVTLESVYPKEQKNYLSISCY